MVFDHYNPSLNVTVPNVNIEDCDYTIAFWIRLTQRLVAGFFNNGDVTILGSSRFGKGLSLYVGETFAEFCREESTESYVTCVVSHSNVVMNNWIHITVTCEQDNGVKMFFNGEIANIYNSWQQFGLNWKQPPPPKE